MMPCVRFCGLITFSKCWGTNRLDQPMPRSSRRYAAPSETGLFVFAEAVGSGWPWVVEACDRGQGALDE
jgi:hypothetical protein